MGHCIDREGVTYRDEVHYGSSHTPKEAARFLLRRGRKNVEERWDPCPGFLIPQDRVCAITALHSDLFDRDQPTPDWYYPASGIVRDVFYEIIGPEAFLGLDKFGGIAAFNAAAEKQDVLRLYDAALEKLQ